MRYRFWGGLYLEGLIFGILRYVIIVHILFGTFFFFSAVFFVWVSLPSTLYTVEPLYNGYLRDKKLAVVERF